RMYVNLHALPIRMHNTAGNLSPAARIKSFLAAPSQLEKQPGKERTEKFSSTFTSKVFPSRVLMVSFICEGCVVRGRWGEWRGGEMTRDSQSFDELCEGGPGCRGVAQGQGVVVHGHHPLRFAGMRPLESQGSSVMIM